MADRLETKDKPVLSQFEFFQIVLAMYRESSGKKLYLRRKTPDRDDIVRFRSILKTAGAITSDRDYGSRVIRVLSVSDQLAEDIVCLVDPTCYVSHLSAMQRWGLTDRTPRALALTRPDRKTAIAALRAHMNEATHKAENNPYPLTLVQHPHRVRRRDVTMYESKTAGAFMTNQGTDIRLSTVGQTFLDMLQRPDLCGGMSHVLDVWEEHASKFLDEIASTIDQTPKALIKSRAGYILEERLGLHHPCIERWKAFGQRGGSRKLDPTRDFAPEFSETWMISLNV
ncbi:MAG: hypothetical protein OXC93_01405 [Rhodospirillaceae bacterium]|nr:hypothetical protein [Rhodospirillaceae bacterium]